MPNYTFPKNFVWGASTAAQQIEGAVQEDGRGESVWDVFARRPGAVHEGANADIACDHYNRYVQDVALMKQLGLTGYRFSVAWPRVMPNRTGAVNPAGLDFYSRLVDELLEAGIEPYLTLYHWDMPYALAPQGGWMNPDSPKWFADYTAVVAAKLGDRVKWWMTFNEQAPFLVGGYLEGWHAPGFKAGWREFLLACKNVMLAHGDAVRAIRARAPKPPMVGMAPVAMLGIPADESPENVEAARSFTFDLRKKEHWHPSLYIEPVMTGKLVPNFKEIFGDDAPDFSAEELKAMSPPLDFLGLNFYNAAHIEATLAGPAEVAKQPGWPPAGQYWKITPEGLYWCVRFYHERYGLPVVITENGLSCQDWVALDGKVHDAPRIDALSRYLLQLHRATEEGFPVLGYFHWSLMDNFEWAEGYKQRFGLIHVDFRTLQRTIKDSGYWYRDVIAANGLRL
jgi:beta-glucosidase